MAKKSKKLKNKKPPVEVNHFDASHRIGTNEGELDLNRIVRKDDGAALFNVTTMRSGIYEYLAFEMPRSLVSQIMEIDPTIGRPDDIVRGAIETAEVRRILSQFEGLAVTNEHVFISVDNIDDAVGRVLNRGRLQSDGYVTSRLVLESSDLLSEIETGNKLEVSIGFRANDPVINENFDPESDDSPHFFLRGIELNHLAVVERGRAGPQARLSHGQSSQYIHGRPWQSIEVKTMKIKLNGVEHEVSDELGKAIQAALDAAQQATSDAESKMETAHNDLATATTQLSTANGQIAALNQQISNADPIKQATDLLIQHESIVDAVKTLGSKVELKFGAYDAEATLRQALTEFGVKGIEHSDYDQLMATYQGVVAASSRQQGVGVLEQSHSQPAAISNTMRSDRGRTRVMDAVHSKFFGRPSPKTQSNAGE